MALPYVPLLFLGGFGAHTFYLGNTASGVIHVVLTLFTLLAAVTIVGSLSLSLIHFLWLVVEAILFPSWTKEASRH